MQDVSERAVLRAIEAMEERMGEQLTVDDLARAALFSKFHFTRIFQRHTGVSPARFLSALRLQRAKDLLLSTTMNVADISVQVGYNSVGTFSSRFSRSVGMSPTTYRRHDGFAPAIQPGGDRRATWPSSSRLSCHVSLAEPDENAVIFLGMFADRIPEGRPVRCAVLHRPGSVRFDAVPQGSWYLLAQSVSAEAGWPGDSEDRADRAVAVASYGPFTVQPDSILSADIVLRRARALDPPVLLALLDARKQAMGVLRTAPSWADQAAA
ncbi:AraC family transcriptional regulator [Actinoplanes ianthinogenes]|uniref:AraC family transcriptional regulator n=1 Tax=Actinoplanes ianthinogenes TaxID=122358 RepID=A0ABM7LPL0_9ACTN|nr:helix-turn-helix transcriptional regulator [Actinoplanes ianthinogenes]BCJ41161.1 AraC family transcriptional regulator [Actinoplanes ianthinogenes]GGR22486.1 AraC family transcriptional regulator [Actinoplanes ianthinogenes]